MIAKIRNDIVLEISLYLNQNSNFKCLRFNLNDENSTWNLISSFGTGKKPYPGKFEFVK